MPRLPLRLLGAFFLIGTLACAGKSAPPAPTSADETQASAAASGNEIQSIQVEDRGAKTAVVVTGNGPMSPNIFKLTDPHRVIIDLPDTKIGSVQTPITVNKAGINQITASQFDDSTSSLSRVVIGLDSPTEYQVESDGNRLTVNVDNVAGAVSPSEVGLPEIPSISEIPSVAEVTPTPEPLAPMEPAPAAEVTAAPVEEPAASTAELVPEMPTAFEATQATELTDVQYASSDGGTTITLVANGPISEYQDLVLKAPQRLVVDLKGMSNQYPGGKNIALGTSEVSQIRLGKKDGSVRVVLDLKGKAKPAYAIQKDGNSLVVNVSAPAVESVPEAAPEEVAAASETTVPEVAPVEAEASVAAAAPVSSGSSPVTVTGIGFKQMSAENKSRLIIGLSEPTADYQVRDVGPDRFVVEVSNARLEKKLLKREFNTTEFNTAILQVNPKAVRKSKTVLIEVTLEQQVPYTVNADGANLVVDVDIPAQLLRKQQPGIAKSGAAIPAPPESGGEPVSMIPDQESGAVAEGLAAKEEQYVDINAPGAEKEKVDGRPKNYRYVKEGFMSDVGRSDEPLSAMGQILAGEFEGRRFTGRKISLDFKDADIRSIFRLIADIAKLNMIISDEVTGNVTVRLDNVPWDQAFAIILQTKALWFEKYGNIVRIAPADKLSREREMAAAAARAAKAAKPLDVLFKPVSYAEAGTLIAQVKSVLSERGTVDIDSRTNTLIIKDVREHLDKARKMVDILDTQTPQVTIEARIVQATSAAGRALGITWGGNARFTPATGNPTGIFFPNSINSNFALNFPINASGIPGTAHSFGFQLGSINNIFDLDVQLEVLEAESQTKLVAAPKVTVLDNMSATITSGVKIPYITQTDNSGSNVRFETAATNLTVTPHVTNDGSVLLTITATESAPSETVVQGNPAIDTRSANTQVLVKSGNTTVLGGIYRTQSGGTTNMFPVLSRIPILGWFFKNHKKSVSRNELLIFVTPKIVGDDREAVRDVRG